MSRFMLDDDFGTQKQKVTNNKKMYLGWKCLIIRAIGLKVQTLVGLIE